MMEEIFPLPRKGHEQLLARRLLGREQQVAARLLDWLLDAPIRVDEVLPLLPGVTERQAEQAICQLGNEGLIGQSLDLEHAGDPRTLSATSLGRLVALKMQKIRNAGKR